MAIMTRWSKTFSGTRTRCGRDFIKAAPVLQTEVQTPQPRQDCSLRTAHFFSLVPSVLLAIVIASTGHALAHLPQPLHLDRSTSMMKLEVMIPGRESSILIDCMTWQQHPQQLQMNATLFWTLSAVWARPASLLFVRMAIASFFVMDRAIPFLARLSDA